MSPINSLRTSIDTIIERINNVHQNQIKVLNPEDYEHQHSRLNFQCEKGHEWDVKVYNVIQGSGCPRCAGKNISTAEFCDTLKEVHNSKLTLVKGQEYSGRKHKLTFQCINPNHKPFKAAPSNVIFQKSGCPECKKEKLRETFKYTETEVYAKIASKKYSFSPLPNQLYTNQETIWKFQCNNLQHPPWEAPVGAYLLGKIKYGCRYCAGERPIGSIEDIHALIIDLFGDNIVLLDSSISTRIIKRTTRFNFLCQKHSVEFKTTLSLLSDSKGCEKCSLESRASKRRKSIDELIANVKNVHRDFISIEDYSKYENTESKILFRCNKIPRHGVFEATAHGVLTGSGCPICRMSKGERKIWFWLNDHSVNFISQKRVRKHTGRGIFIFDFYLPEKKLIIEYDGRQHSLPVERWGGKKGLLKVQENDKLKDAFAELIGFKMLRIPYTQYDSVEEILQGALSVVSEFRTLDFIGKQNG